MRELRRQADACFRNDAGADTVIVETTIDDEPRGDELPAVAPWNDATVLRLRPEARRRDVEDFPRPDPDRLAGRHGTALPRAGRCTWRIARSRALGRARRARRTAGRRSANS